MNWKSSLTGAVLVIVVGLAVGFAVGGKKSERTITVVRKRIISKTKTVTLATTVAAKSAKTTTSTTTTPAATSTTANSSQQYYASYLNTQNTGTNADQASLDDSPSTQELNGNTYANAVAFDLDPSGNGDPTDTYQLPIPGFTTFTSSVAGLVTSASANASYKLTIYKNNDNPGATVLYSNTFTGPSGTHPVSFKTQGATDLLLVWTNTSYDINSGNSDTFVFADPVVTTGK